MTSMFREMMQCQQNPPTTGAHVDQQLPEPPSATPNEPGTMANKRTATDELELVHADDESMDIDGDLQSTSRKRNNQNASPEKPGAPLFPLFRLDRRNKEVSRNLFGKQSKKVSPTNVPLPPSPVREASTPPASLTDAEDAQQSISSGNESKHATPPESHMGDQSPTASTC
jgi:hypothetical protein